MFSLGKNIHGNPVGIGLSVTDDKDFRGACDHVDATLPKHKLLRSGHVDIAGADNLVHSGNGSCAISQGCHCLRTTDTKHTVHTG